jgi:glycosyltransferase involved in cell wall biosynthesis
MRIGLISGEFPPHQGGVGAYTQILARKFAEQHHTYILTANDGLVRQDSTFEFDYAHWNLHVASTVRKWANTNCLDVINLQYQTAAFGMSPWIHFIPEHIDTPFVTTFHDLRFPYLFPKAGGLRTKIVEHLAKRSHAVVATNQDDFERLRSHPNAHIIPIGSNIPSQPQMSEMEKYALRQQLNIPFDHFLIVFFGLLNSSKGIDTLLHAVATLRDSGLPCTLLIVGDAGTSDPTNNAYAEKINTLTEQLHLTADVVKTGFVVESDVNHYLQIADCVALPFVDGASFRRGSLMAAIQAGCAIVTTLPNTDIALFRHNVNMLMVPSGDSAALAAALRMIFADANLRTSLQIGARALAQHFNWDDIAESFINVFTHVSGLRT